MASRLPSQCPDCGTQLAADSWSAGVCPGCLMGLARIAPTVADEVEAEEQPTQLSPGSIRAGEAPTMELPGGTAPTDEADWWLRNEQQ